MISLDGIQAPRRWSRTAKNALRVAVLGAVLYFLVLPQMPAFRAAASELRDVRPVFLLVGVALVMASISCYSGLTRSALGDDDRVSHLSMFRIQLATRSVTNVVPGGSAAGSALGFRLLTSAGVAGPAAGFALATAALGSAVVLNIVFWFGLAVSIPIRGVNPLYAIGALAGVFIMAIVAVLCIGLIDGSGRAERAVSWVARRLRLDPDRWAHLLREVGDRVTDLVADRSLLRRVVGWSLGQWLFDMAALWVFLRAFGYSLDIDALIVAFGLANILAAIPITPGGLGVVEAVYLTTLVGFGVPAQEAALGVAAYRIAQYFFPIAIGAVAYLSLRLGPWPIRDEQLTAELPVDGVSPGDTTKVHVKDIASAATQRRSERKNPGRGRPDHAGPRIDTVPEVEEEVETVEDGELGDVEQPEEAVAETEVVVQGEDAGRPAHVGGPKSDVKVADTSDKSAGKSDGRPADAGNGGGNGKGKGRP